MTRPRRGAGAIGANVADPVWRLPFHAPYEKMIEPGIADLDNAPKGGFAGSITAALFLRRFAAEAAPTRISTSTPGPPATRPDGPRAGSGRGSRAIFETLPKVLLNL
jgi:leucyl aminopeptidase